MVITHFLRKDEKILRIHVGKNELLKDEKL
jgi:hypothetical protein